MAEWLIGREAARVAEFGEDRACHLRADAGVAHQGAAARLGARGRLEVTLQRAKLLVDVVRTRVGRDGVQRTVAA